MVEEVTGFPEMLDGRVKTLHPKIHAGILADRDNPEHMRQLEQHGIKPIDMVVVNLYPFEKTVADPNCTFEQAIEMIDIGGPCMLRAALKNNRHVVVIFDHREYSLTLELMRDADSRSDWSIRGEARDGFMRTAWYDAQISQWLSRMPQFDVTSYQFLRFVDWGELRYGENPHQQSNVQSIWDERQASLDLVTADLIGEVHDDSTLSFNNYADADAALALCAELTRARKTGSTCVFIKHTNSCGVGIADDPIEAYRRAYLGDPNAAMGGILAVNFAVTAAFAEVVMESFQKWGKGAGAGAFFVEVLVAPSFDDDAIQVIRTRKKWGEKVRLLEVGPMDAEPDPNELDYKRIAGGMLVQSRDLVGLNEDQWKVVTKRPPTDAEMADLRLAWLVAKHTKSNAISICKDGMLIGNGAGQMSRVMSCRIATWLAKENGHADKLAGSVAASDAFFPFRDGPDLLIEAGVTAIIQPGGSKRDDETIAACDERSVAMIHTGTRHFRH
jgi:phosphoribosylaminoimidazolecarboxamide formyltransferase/IMP cyclohydrolase